MDKGSIIGIISGAFLIASAIWMGGEVSSFWHIPGLMIVIGGTLAATLINFILSDVLMAFRAALYVLKNPRVDPNDMVFTMIHLCNTSRKDGIIALSQIETEHPFLKKACDLIADGSDEKMIRKTLEIEIDSLRARHFNVQEVFRKMGTFAPAFGMLGTLIGMVQMLGNIADPEQIGPAMATALLTTFYGSLLSTLFFLPIAGKLRANTINEVINLRIIFEGAVSILEINNPLFVYEKLSAYIPAKLRRPMKSFARMSSNE